MNVEIKNQGHNEVAAKIYHTPELTTLGAIQAAVQGIAGNGCDGNTVGLSATAS